MTWSEVLALLKVLNISKPYGKKVNEQYKTQNVFHRRIKFSGRWSLLRLKM